MTQPKPLSAEAQAVLDAADNASSFGPDEIPCDARWIAAAVLRAAAKNVAENVHIPNDGKCSVIFEDDLLAIVDELEGGGPAVPEGREPASVMGEPSNEDLLELTKGWSWTTDKRHDLPGSPDMLFFSVFEDELIQFARAVLARWGNHSSDPTQIVVERALADARAALAAGKQAPPARGTPGPSIEDFGPLISWLTEQACQAADASQSTAAGMLTWAAQVIGERVDEDALTPPARGEVAELVAQLASRHYGPEALDRAAELLQQQQAEIEILTAYALPIPQEEAES